MIYNKNLVIFIILIILVLGCVYSVNNYYERNIILKFYNNNLEKNSLIPSKPILDSGLILLCR